MIEQVAVRFADRFEPADRAYDGGRPQWHGQVRGALAALRAGGLLDGKERLTEAGLAAAEGAATAVAAEPVSTVESSADEPAGPPPLLSAGVIAPPLRNPADRAPDGVRQRRGPADSGDGRAQPALRRRRDGGFRGWTRCGAGSPATAARPGCPSSTRPASLSVQEIEAAGRRRRRAGGVAAARAAPALAGLPGPLHVDGSCVTVKADAARRSFNAYGDRIVWAVVDSGIGAATRTSRRTTRSTTRTSRPAPGLPGRRRAGDRRRRARRTRPGTARTSPGSSPAPSSRGWPRPDAADGPGHREPLQRREPARAAARAADAVDEPDAAGRHGPAGEAGQPQGPQRRRRPSTTGSAG